MHYCALFLIFFCCLPTDLSQQRSKYLRKVLSTPFGRSSYHSASISQNWASDPLASKKPPSHSKKEDFFRTKSPTYKNFNATYGPASRGTQPFTQFKSRSSQVSNPQNEHKKWIMYSQRELGIQIYCFCFQQVGRIYNTYTSTLAVSSTSWACGNCIQNNPRTILIPKGLVIVIMDNNWLHLVCWPASDSDKCHWNIPILSLLPTNCMTFQKNCICLSRLSYVLHC